MLPCLNEEVHYASSRELLGDFLRPWAIRRAVDPFRPLWRKPFQLGLQGRVEYGDLRITKTLPSLFPQNFQYPGNGLADVVLEFHPVSPNFRIDTGSYWPYPNS